MSNAARLELNGNTFQKTKGKGKRADALRATGEMKLGSFGRHIKNQNVDIKMADFRRMAVLKLGSFGQITATSSQLPATSNWVCLGLFFEANRDCTPGTREIGFVLRIFICHKLTPINTYFFYQEERKGMKVFWPPIITNKHKLFFYYLPQRTQRTQRETL